MSEVVQGWQPLIFKVICMKMLFVIVIKDVVDFIARVFTKSAGWPHGGGCELEEVDSATEGTAIQATTNGH